MIRKTKLRQLSQQSVRISQELGAVMPEVISANRLFDIGIATAKRIGVSMRVAILRAYIHNEPFNSALLKPSKRFEDLLQDAMVAGHLAGRLRALESAAKHLPQLLGPYDASTKFMQDRLQLDKAQLVNLQSQYGQAAVNVTKDMGALVERKAKVAVAEITKQGMHVKQGVQHLRKAMEKAGIEIANPWYLENIVRSQTQMAYMAGRWNANQDPAIDEILWGYEYFTVGDDRVRPGHEALEGTVLKKDDPRWSEIWPPNGWSCRCDVAEVYKDDKHVMKEPPKEGMADPGWAVNHGQVFTDTFDLPAAYIEHVSRSIDDLLDMLLKSVDPTEKKAIRRILRKKGHKGGLRGEKPKRPVGVKPKPTKPVPTKPAEALFEATNVGKAEANACKILDIPITDPKARTRISYKGIDVKTANHVNHGLYNFKQKFPQMKLDAIEIGARGKNIYAEVHVDYKTSKATLILSEKDFKSYKAISKALKRNGKTNYLVADDIEGLVAHEMGHNLNMVYLSRKHGSRARMEMDRLKTIHFNQEGLSKYATADGSEGLAEVFSKYMRTGNFEGILFEGKTASESAIKIKRIMKTYVGIEL